MNAYAAQPANILTIQQLSKKFGSRFAVQQATWSAMSGQIICLLGQFRLWQNHDAASDCRFGNGKHLAAAQFN